jgi:hypothetical protein
MVLSRLRRPMEFVPLDAVEIEDLMRHYHPVYAGVRNSLLRRIDDRFGHGVLRNWNEFTATAVDVCASRGRATINREIVTECLAKHSTRPVLRESLGKAA